MVEALFERSDAIATHPLAGRVVPELHDRAVRERFLYSYRVIDEARAERVEILAVLHGRRLLDSIEKRFEE